MFQPVLTSSGYTGWKFLQATYDRQLESFSNSPQIKADREYFTEKLSQPLALDDFLDDRRLMRVALTAFDLGGEEWKRGYIEKVLTEVNDPDSSFLQRLNNAQYSEFARTFAPIDGAIYLTPTTVDELGAKYEEAAFRTAIGEVDNSMRLALNYESQIGSIVGTGSSSENAIIYRILGNVPIRSVVERALNLPESIRKLPIEQQAEMVKDKLQSRMRISDVRTLAEPGTVESMLRQYHAMETIASGASASYSPSQAALTLLGGSGVGSSASQNLFLSIYGS